jgi:hypothetical protein
MREPEMPVINRVLRRKGNIVPVPAHGDSKSVAKAGQEIDVLMLHNSHATNPEALNPPICASEQRSAQL